MRSPVSAASLRRASTRASAVMPELTAARAAMRAEVKQTTEDRQTPWENTSIIGDFYFLVPEDPVQASGCPDGATRDSDVIRPSWNP